MIIERVGKAAMYEMLAEECIELAHVALKMARTLRDENPSGTNALLLVPDLQEEYTDVVCCAEELCLYPDGVVKMEKVNRFMRRWQEKKDKEGGYDE